MNIIQRPTVNYNDRAGNVDPNLIIVHYTGTKTADDAAAYYLNQVKDEAAGPISPHYMIDGDGTVYQFVDDAKRAWHAGVSEWQGEKDINSTSIGIELVNEGEFNNYPKFEDAQIDRLVELCQDLQQRFNISAADVIGHDDIAPGRKKDPGPSFPWTSFRARLLTI